VTERAGVGRSDAEPPLLVHPEVVIVAVLAAEHEDSGAPGGGTGAGIAADLDAAAITRRAPEPEELVSGAASGHN
jgi:hypothetical protein